MRKYYISQPNTSIVSLTSFAVCDGALSHNGGYHEAKSLCVAFFDIPVVFHTKLDLN